MIVDDIQALFMKLLADPEGFTAMEMKDLERKLDLWKKAKALDWDLDLVDDEQMIDSLVVG